MTSVVSWMRKVIVIDDEVSATQGLKRELDNISEVEVIGCYNNPEQGIEAICQLLPDIVFLDIDMPVIDGFMVAKATEHINYHLVFVTAYAEHALTAFDTKVVDYLLKPVRPSRLIRCLEKIERLSHDIVMPDVTEIAVYDGKRNHLLASNDISFIESIGRYQRVNLTAYGRSRFNLDSIITEESMANFELQLDSERFMRIHRSYIVNLTQIAQVLRQSRHTLVKLFDVDEPISVARAKVGLLNEYFLQCR